METIDVRTAHNVVIESEVAGVGDRILAYLVDTLLMSAYFITLLVVMNEISYSLAAFILLYLPALLYFPASEIFLDGQTLGKKAVRIKVTRLDGNQPGIGDYLLRFLLLPIDVWISSGVVAILTILLNGKGQRLGDIVAGTTVVKVRKRMSLSNTVLANLEENYQPVFPQAARLTMDEAQLARDVIRELRRDPEGEHTLEIALRTKQALERRLEIQSEMPAYQFLRTLVKDFNYYNGRL